MLHKIMLLKSIKMYKNIIALIKLYLFVFVVILLRFFMTRLQYEKLGKVLG